MATPEVPMKEHAYKKEATVMDAFLAIKKFATQTGVTSHSGAAFSSGMHEKEGLVLAKYSSDTWDGYAGAYSMRIATLIVGNKKIEMESSLKQKDLIIDCTAEEGWGVSTWADATDTKAPDESFGYSYKDVVKLLKETKPSKDATLALMDKYKKLQADLEKHTELLE